MTTRLLLATLLFWAFGALGTGWPPTGQFPRSAVHAQQPAPVDEFVPIDELPPQDQLPAAPLLVTAYAFVVLMLFAYLVSLAKRLGGVQRDLDRLQSELKHNGRS